MTCVFWVFCHRKASSQGRAETERSPSPTGVRSSERFTADLPGLGEAPAQPAGPQSPPPSIPFLPDRAHRSVPTAPRWPAGSPASSRGRDIRSHPPARPPHWAWRTSAPTADLGGTRFGPCLGCTAPGRPSPSAALGTHLQQGLGLLQHSCSLCPSRGLVSPRIRLKPVTPAPQNGTAPGAFREVIQINEAVGEGTDRSDGAHGKSGCHRAPTEERPRGDPGRGQPSAAGGHSSSATP